ncbi:MAG: hypothetical protein EZS28_016006 [Streblomastix strix]|uniref:SPRY domain-containing protein n=1 Tax=Streblomastix strix TaxID=222440 RepID=A0A5J4W0Q9_9EUKA|nr:MAG: hypothetical protein EZS28_016006 [Streblomastix strix]
MSHNPISWLKSKLSKKEDKEPKQEEQPTKQNQEKVEKVEQVEEVEKAEEQQEVREEEKKIVVRTGPITPELVLDEDEHGSVQGGTFIHSQKSEDACITVNPIITTGVVRCEFVFDLKQGKMFIVGIADYRLNFTRERSFWDDDNKNLNIRYINYSGVLNHIAGAVSGNTIYKSGQKIAVEVNMGAVPRTCHFFVDEIEQPIHVINIPQYIRFWSFIAGQNSYFTITRFERLENSSAHGVEGSKAVEYGKVWEDD